MGDERIRLNSRVEELIARLDLARHPEGGWYRQIYRSDAAVKPEDRRPERAALTTIYFLLAAGELSRWHRVASDEVWHFYEGSTLELYTADARFADVQRTILGEIGHASTPAHVVPPGIWQAARTTGSYTLVGCTVAPGFDFADFELLSDRPADRDLLQRQHSELGVFL
jgi:predicted cupin superfamily sugar epimerase